MEKPFLFEFGGKYKVFVVREDTMIRLWQYLSLKHSVNVWNCETRQLVR